MLMRHQEDSDADSDDEDEVDTEALLRQAQQMLADKKAEKAAQRDRARKTQMQATPHLLPSTPLPSTYCLARIV